MDKLALHSKALAIYIEAFLSLPLSLSLLDRI